MTVNFSNGFFPLTGGVNFNGSNPNDHLTVTGNQAFANVTDTLTGAQAGDVLYDAGLAGALDIHYSSVGTTGGQAAVTLNGNTITNLSVNLPNVVNTATLADNGSLVELSSSPGTFATTDFANLAGGGLLSISGGSGGNSVTVGTLTNFTRSLDINAGASPATITVNGALNLAGSLDLTAGTINVNNDETTSGTQTYTGAVVVGASVTLKGTTVTFGGTVDDAVAGTHSLTVNGAAVFDGIVGGTALDSLHVINGTTFNAGATAVTTGSTQAYDGAITVGADLDLTAGLTVTFGSTVDDTLAGSHDLIVNADAVFNGIVGGVAGVTALESLDVTDCTTFNPGASAVTTTGTQTYECMVTVGDNLDLTGTTVTFFGAGATVDDATAGTHTLTVTGDAVFDDVVGGTRSKPCM